MTAREEYEKHRNDRVTPPIGYMGGVPAAHVLDYADAALAEADEKLDTLGHDYNALLAKLAQAEAELAKVRGSGAVGNPHMSENNGTVTNYSGTAVNNGRGGFNNVHIPLGNAVETRTVYVPIDESADELVEALKRAEQAEAEVKRLKREMEVVEASAMATHELLMKAEWMLSQASEFHLEQDEGWGSADDSDTLDILERRWTERGGEK